MVKRISISSIKRKIFDFVEADREYSQVLWSEAFNADGTLVKRSALQFAVHKMQAAVANETALEEILQLNLTEEEVSRLWNSIGKFETKRMGK